MAFDPIKRIVPTTITRNDQRVRRRAVDKGGVVPADGLEFGSVSPIWRQAVKFTLSLRSHASAEAEINGSEPLTLHRTHFHNSTPRHAWRRDLKQGDYLLSNAIEPDWRAV